MAVVTSGSLDEDSVEKLQRAWRRHRKLASKKQTAADLAASQNELVPIVILGKGFAPKHEHGKLIGGRNTSATCYTLYIPAVLAPNGSLSASGGSIPWIGREYLRPNDETDENIPLVGELAAYDDWLNKHPLNQSSWDDFMRWCDALWAQVVGEHVPDGFVPLPSVCVDIATSIKNAGSGLCQLYDVLQIEERLPPLLEGICQGRQEHEEVGCDLRLQQLKVPRGTMSTSYCLAPSQADAAAAYTTLKAGQVLAVNGPPGTGKTTFLQSVIATEVVTRAMAGEQPAVIIGTSVNNLPIINIVRSLNEVLRENSAAGHFPWARRWIHDAETYGLYITANKKMVQEALDEGYAVATPTGNQWHHFPERESDPEYLAQATSKWLQGHAETYGFGADSVLAGLDNLRRDLGIISAETSSIQATLQRFHEINQWWRTAAGESTPAAYLEAEAVKLSSEIDLLTQDLEEKEANVADARKARESTEALLDKAPGELTRLHNERQAYMRKLFGVKARVNEAFAPHGFLEALAEKATVMRGLFRRRQLSRLCALAAEDPLIGELFEEQAHENDPEAWMTRLDSVMRETAAETKRLCDDQSEEVKRLKKRFAEFNEEWKGAVRKRDSASRKVAKARRDSNTRLDLLRSKALEIEHKAEELKQAHAVLRSQAVSDFLVEPSRIEVPLGLPAIQDFDKLLDITWRHMAFQKAMRYWEGRWILEAQAVQEDRINTRTGQSGMEARFRRWCMLTPCLIVTVHSLPKYFRFSSRIREKTYISAFMLNFIDLLIMDEAGQVGPHVGAATFALASRAVVVGDVHQIEPISRISRGTDYANSARVGLHQLWQNGEPSAPHLVSEPSDSGPQGSMMRLAQSATIVVSAGTEKEPGIFLAEHRRCRSEIIEFCNRLVYKNRLLPLSPPRPQEPPLPPMAWAHVRGIEERVGNSRANESEAEAIAGWIAKNADSWCRHYGKPIDEIVGVVTPFKPQSGRIADSLKQHGEKFIKVTVGTVHSLQGAERPIIIFSPTYNADTAKGMRFDVKPNMLNVAVSRAKDSFVVIGDVRLFRKKGGSPSAILGQMLFAEQRNEVTDVEGNFSFPRQLLAQAERISNTERHREVLRTSILQCNQDWPVLIASPWITAKAIASDGLESLIREAVGERRGQVWIVVDGELSSRYAEHNGQQALLKLKEAGATICIATRMHNKTLINGSSEIIEGSFNWLSAHRERGDEFLRHEVSWRITGKTAVLAIQSALEEFSKLGSEPIPRSRFCGP